MKRFFVLIFFLITSPAWSAIYYVDSAGSNTSPYDTWAKAANQINTIVSGYSLIGGDVIFCRGTVSSHTPVAISTGDVGSNVHSLENVNVSDSIVTFSTTPSGVSANTDYVYLYNSFRGNSGAFDITAVNGTAITVDTSELPGGSFITENTSNSPWNLQAAIIRPVRLIGCDSNGTARADYAEFVGGNYFLDMTGADYWYVSYCYHKDGNNYNLKVVGNASVASDYVALDHIKLRGTNGWVILDIDPGEYGDNGGDLTGTIVQHSEFWWLNPSGSYTQEVIYHGHGSAATDKCINTQIMYNEIWTSGSISGLTEDDGIDGKENNDYTMIWGNYFHDLEPDFGGIKLPAGNVCAANNYFKNVNPQSSSDYGVVSQFSYGLGGKTHYIFNNIFDSCYDNNIGLGPTSAGTTCIWNNTFYGRKSNDTAIKLGINSATGYIAELKNNIFQHYAVGIDNSDGTISADADNIWYDNTTNYSGWTPNDTDHVGQDPNLVNPSSGDFSIGSSAYAKDKGSTISTFSVDNHDAANPTLAGLTQLIFRPQNSAWDIGAYEYVPTVQILKGSIKGSIR